MAKDASVNAKDSDFGRPNQRRRTRKDLLEAAARLMKSGASPSLEEVAAEALVSRATAYRYFPGIEELLREAALDVRVPDTAELFRGVTVTDPVSRMEMVDDALDGALAGDEMSFRLMLAHAVKERALHGGDGNVPVRQNRRTPMIEAALEPARDEIAPAKRRYLSAALALLVGTESMVVFKDVLNMDEAGAKKVKRWAIRALIEAARKP